MHGQSSVCQLSSVNDTINDQRDPKKNRLRRDGDRLNASQYGYLRVLSRNFAFFRGQPYILNFRTVLEGQSSVL